MGALHAAGFPLEDLHNGAVLGLACGDGVAGREALGAQKWDVLAGELQQVGSLPGLGLYATITMVLPD
jgi:hypothetical protein